MFARHRNGHERSFPSRTMQSHYPPNRCNWLRSLPAKSTNENTVTITTKLLADSCRFFAVVHSRLLSPTIRRRSVAAFLDVWHANPNKSPCLRQPINRDSHLLLHRSNQLREPITVVFNYDRIVPPRFQSSGRYRRVNVVPLYSVQLFVRVRPAAGLLRGPFRE